MRAEEKKLGINFIKIKKKQSFIYDEGVDVLPKGNSKKTPP